MNNGLVVLPIACVVSILSGCAYFKSPNSTDMWSVKPTMTTRNSAESAESMYQLGRYYQGQNRYGQAISAYRKALAADNSYADAHNGLGVIYWLQGKYAESLEEFRNAVEKSPGAARFHNNLGYAYYLHGRHGEAIATLEKSLVLEPDNKRTRENLSLAYNKAGIKAETALARLQAQKKSLVSAIPTTKEQPMVKAVASGAVIQTAPGSEAQLIEKIVHDKSDPHVIPLVTSPLTVVQTSSNTYELRENSHDIPVTVVSMSEPESKSKPAEAKAVEIKAVEAKAVEAEADSIDVALEVSNGNGVNGMAKQMGLFLKQRGYGISRLTNQKPFQTQKTVIQYREGHFAQAKELQSSMPGVSLSLVESKRIRPDIAVRLVLGRDMVGRMASLNVKSKAKQVALNESGN